MSSAESSDAVDRVRPALEESLNTATHGLGFVLSLLATTALVPAAEQIPLGRTLACGLYLLTLIAVYAISTLSHAVQQPDRKHALRILDQGVIYLLIAGTYTPIMWTYLEGPLKWCGLLGVWAAALAGKYSKIVARRRITDFSSLTYLLLGWVPAMLLIGSVPLSCFTWLGLGGLAYTAGTVFLMTDHKRVYFHAIWHLLVIAGSGCHFYGIYQYVIRMPAGA